MATDETDFSAAYPEPTDRIREDFARRLSRARLAKGWTEAELARRAGIGRDSVNNYAKRKTTPSPLSLQKMAKALGVKPEDLMPSHVYVDEPVRQSFDLRVNTKDPNLTWVFMDREVASTVAAKILDLVIANDAAQNAANAS